MLNIPHLDHCDCPRCCSEPKLLADCYETVWFVVKATGVRLTSKIWWVYYEGQPKSKAHTPFKGNMPLARWNKTVKEYPTSQ